MSSRIIAACIDVHRHCGPGLLESIYERCLAHELALRSMRFTQQQPIGLVYKGLTLDGAFRADFIVEDAIVVELKAVDALAPVHVAQVLSYLNLARVEVGLLVNFNALYLRDGVRRLVRRPGTTMRYAHAFTPTPWPSDP